jgi:lipopolysaccharide/colanic/teichoic acid biosynthesis glycosyltransferase
VRRVVRTVLYLGIAAIVVGLSLLHASVIADPPYSYTGTFRFGWSLLYVALAGLTAYGFGLPDLPRTPRAALLAAVGAAVTGAIAISVLQLVTGDALLPRFVVFGSALLLIPWYLACAAAFGGGVSAAGRDRVVVIGDDVNLAGLRAEFARSPERPALVTSVLRIADAERDGTPVADHVRDEGAGVLVLDRDAQASERIVAQTVPLHADGVRVRTLSRFYEEWLGKLPVTELERVSLLFDIGEVHRNRYGRVKRLFDVVLALLGAVVALVVTPAVLIGDLVANRGPLLYRQARVGKNGEVFTIVKLRTMRQRPDGADDDGPPGEWTAEDDPRITPFGRFLRVTHVDELPQVLNILRGDLSVVGPRPEQPHYVAELTEKLPYYAVRHLARPGLTGWAQVKYGYAGDERDALEKLQYDMYYLRHQGVRLDVRIAVRTLRSVLGREGR